jgi:hypothetical protein
MPITIDGTGSITGLSAGGLPDGVITTDDIAANAVTTAKLGSNEASGLCKAWVNFNGTGTVAIRASYNVSSITDNGVGDYTVNFTTAMAGANYVLAGSASDTAQAPTVNPTGTASYLAGSCRLDVFQYQGSKYDSPLVLLAFFR